MSISEMEEQLGITNKDKISCPFAGDDGCDDCKMGLDQETCEESYEVWLVQQLL